MVLSEKVFMSRLTLGPKVLPVKARRGIGHRSIRRNRCAQSSRYGESLFIHSVYHFLLKPSVYWVVKSSDDRRRQAYVFFIDPRKWCCSWDSSKPSESLYKSIRYRFRGSMRGLTTFRRTNYNSYNITEATNKYFMRNKGTLHTLALPILSLIVIRISF